MGVYVHFPWCLTKCPYCDFLSVAVRQPGGRETLDAKAARALLPHEAYADAVLRELDARIARVRRPLPALGSIFFGGGTPSLWAPREMGRVIRGIRSAFRATDAAIEVTAECNPSSLDPAQLEGMQEAGVGRVSIGVQSLDSERLGFLGRLHDEAGALSAVARAIERTDLRVSADLIFGVHGQNPAAARAEAARVAELGVTHLSAYALTIEDNTRFGTLARKGRLPLLGEDLVADSFWAVHETLAGHGLEHYEISNYARPGHESVHNRGYWLGHDYLGLGTGAYGTVHLGGESEGRLRYKNLLVPERYLDAFSEQVEFDPFSEHLSDRETISGATSITEAILLGLRLRDGLCPSELEARFGAPFWTEDRRRGAERLEARGMLELKSDRLRIPVEHWLFGDGIIRELI